MKATYFSYIGDTYSQYCLAVHFLTPKYWQLFA